MDISSLSTKTPKVAIIEENFTDFAEVQGLLRELGVDSISLKATEDVLDRLKKEKPDVIFLDFLAEDSHGVRCLENLKNDDFTRALPVVAITSLDNRSKRVSEIKGLALRQGAMDFLCRPLDRVEISLRLQNVIQLKTYQEWLRDKDLHIESVIQERTKQLIRSRLQVIQRLAKAAEYRDNETGRHVQRVSLYSSLIAKGLGYTRDKIEIIQQTSSMHDLGKIGIPDSILLKQGKLTTTEWSLMRRHTTIGFEMLKEKPPGRDEVYSSIGMMDSDENFFLSISAMIALTHHEKWDGTGYPYGLVGNEIPIEGRIVALADVFDALQTARPYKEAYPLETCLKIIRESSGRHFDPQIVEIFLSNSSDVEKISADYAEPTNLV